MSRVVHFEIHAGDPETLMTFYQGVLGWRFERFGDHDYWTIVTTDPATDDHRYHIQGGLTRRTGPAPQPGAPGGYVCYVGTGDAHAVWDAALAAGAVEAQPLAWQPGVGWTGHLLDPEGNRFGVIEPDPESMPPDR